MFSVTTVPLDIKVRLHRTIGDSAFHLKFWQCSEALKLPRWVCDGPKVTQVYRRRKSRAEGKKMVKMMAYRLEETIGEMRVWRREVEGDTVHRRDSYREEELRREARVKCVKVPFFSGDDPHGWVYRVERYFEVNRVPEAEKVDTAVVLRGRL
ncbi:hypothetical protein V8G54_007402 [Vigna mungo]|uniref:Uncharacterized protein n=1 Tax=Vigna mungo TaxID=3915 RepID=A0AAQ3P378_VIGMU